MKGRKDAGKRRRLSGVVFEKRYAVEGAKETLQLDAIKQKHSLALEFAL